MRLLDRLMAEDEGDSTYSAARGRDNFHGMTKDQIKDILDRVLTWPAERQRDAVDMLLLLEAQEGEFYHPSDDEWDAIREGLEQARRGEFVPDEEIKAIWQR